MQIVAQSFFKIDQTSTKKRCNPNYCNSYTVWGGSRHARHRHFEKSRLSRLYSIVCENGTTAHCDICPLESRFFK